MANKNWLWGILAVAALGATATYLYTDFWEHTASKVATKKASMSDFITKYREVQRKRESALAQDHKDFQDEAGHTAALQTTALADVSPTHIQQEQPFSLAVSDPLSETARKPSKAEPPNTATQSLPLNDSGQNSPSKLVSAKKQDAKPEQ